MTVDEYGDPVDQLRPTPRAVAEPVAPARESAPRFRRPAPAPAVEHRVEPARLHDLPPGVGGVRDTLPGPHGGNGHARAPEPDPRLSAAFAHLPDAVGTPVLPMDGEIPSGGVPSGDSVGLGVDRNVFAGVSPSQAHVPAAAAAQQMAAQPGVWMIVPGAGSGRRDGCGPCSARRLRRVLGGGCRVPGAHARGRPLLHDRTRHRRGAVRPRVPGFVRGGESVLFSGGQCRAGSQRLLPGRPVGGRDDALSDGPRRGRRGLPIRGGFGGLARRVVGVGSWFWFSGCFRLGFRFGRSSCPS